MEDLEAMEDQMSICEAYIWLSGKFEVNFVETELAHLLKDVVTDIIT